MKNPKISPHVAVSIVAVAAASVSLWEWRTLNALDHPPLRKTNCVVCHADAPTLKKMAEKAGDDLYLVHRGDLKAEDMKAQAGKVSDKTAWDK